MVRERSVSEYGPLALDHLSIGVSIAGDFLEWRERGGAVSGGPGKHHGILHIL